MKIDSMKKVIVPFLFDQIKYIKYIVEFCWCLFIASVSKFIISLKKTKKIEKNVFNQVES